MTWKRCKGLETFDMSSPILGYCFYVNYDKISKYHKNEVSWVCSPRSSVVLEWVPSLWPGDGIWWHRSGSTLAQVMACCRYANQCFSKGCKVVPNTYLVIRAPVVHTSWHVFVYWTGQLLKLVFEIISNFKKTFFWVRPQMSLMMGNASNWICA